MTYAWIQKKKKRLLIKIKSVERIFGRVGGKERI